MIEVTATHLASPLAWGTAAHLAALRDGQTALRHDHYFGLPEPTTAAIFPHQAITERFIATFGTEAGHTLTRFEQLVALSVHEAAAEGGITLDDPAVLFILATTKGNVHLLDATDEPHIPRHRVALSEAATAVAQHLHLQRTPIVVSNACISGSHALLLASQRLAEDSTLRHVIVCGADLLSRFIVSGFGAFKALSPEVCRPFDAARCGLNLGEAAATLILSRTDGEVHYRPSSSSAALSHRWTLRSGCVRNDANHISGPSRTGEGVYRALCATLGLSEESNIESLEDLQENPPHWSDDPDWKSATSHLACVSCHGTATAYNDEMESIALYRAGLTHLPAYSLKSTFGHTLGAAGVLETILTMAAVEQGTLWGTRGYSASGVSHELSLSSEAHPLSGDSFLKLLSGFGGCNAVLWWQMCDVPQKKSALLAHDSEASPEISEQSKKTSEIFQKTSEFFQKTSEFFQKTSEIFPKTLEIFPKNSHVFSETSDNTILPSNCSASSLPSLEVDTPMARTFTPIAAVDITPEGISIDGIALPFEERGAALLPAAYKNLIWGYPKFHKMDVLSQLAFVATELLVQSIPHLDAHTAVVFLTHHGSLAADVHYQSTIVPTAEEFFPSPAAFVYTLPNIATGEVAIRHHWHGHTACYALPTTAEEALQQSLILSPASDGRTTAIVGGWLDAEDAEHFSAHLQLYLPTTNI